MATILTIMVNDLRRRWRSPLSLIVYLAFPFIFSGLMAMAFGGDNDTNQAPRFSLALVNQDTGYAGSLIAGAFQREQMSQHFEALEVDSVAAMKLIRENKVGGALLIPRDFSDRLLDREPTQLMVIKNPASSIAPMAIEEVSEMIAMALDGLVTLLGEPLALIRSGINGSGGEPAAWDDGPLDMEMAEISVMINRTMKSVGKYAFPPLIRLEETDDLMQAGEPVSALPEDDAAGEGETADEVSEDDTSGFRLVFQYVMPGMGAFALIILALGFLSDIPRERGEGTLARQMTAPVTIRQIITGKLMAAVVMGLLMALTMAMIGALVLGIRADLLGFLALCTTFIFGLTGFLLLFFAFSRSESQGSVFAWIVMMAMSMLGGSFIPLNQLPDFVSVLAKGTLNYYVIVALQDLIFNGAGLVQLGPTLLLFVCVGIVGMLVGSWVLQRRLTAGG
jgi:ABC-type Na+ efflux pump permease subunit